MSQGPRAVATAVERSSRALFRLSMQAMEGSDPLRPSALRALLALAESTSLTVGELADDLGLSQSATSRLVDRLVQQGLADRREAAHDRRQLTVSATSDGRDVVTRLVERRRRAMTHVLTEMPEDDRAALQRGLEAFAAAAARTGSPRDTL